MAGTQFLEHTALPPRDCTSKRLESGAGAGYRAQYSDMGCEHLRHEVKCSRLSQATLKSQARERTLSTVQEDRSWVPSHHRPQAIATQYSQAPGQQHLQRGMQDLDFLYRNKRDTFWTCLPLGEPTPAHPTTEQQDRGTQAGGIPGSCLKIMRLAAGQGGSGVGVAGAGAPGRGTARQKTHIPS